MAADALTWAAQGSLLAAALSLLVLALHLRDSVPTIAGFAAESALTAGAFFVLASPFAAPVERTVGAGIAALFLGGPFPRGSSSRAGPPRSSGSRRSSRRPSGSCSSSPPSGWRWGASGSTS